MSKICLTVALMLGAGTALAGGPKDLEPAAAKALFATGKGYLRVLWAGEQRLIKWLIKL